MDKKYYSARHNRYNNDYSRRKKISRSKGYSFLRINLCLGIAIVTVGLYEIGGEYRSKAVSFCDDYIFTTTKLDTIAENIDSVKSIISGNSSVKVFAFNGNEVVLDKAVIDKINNDKDLYYINNSKASEP